MPNTKEINSFSKTLEDLVLISGLSGYEINVRNYLKNTLKNHDTTSDVLGNLICTMQGDESLPLLFFSHIWINLDLL